MGVTSGCSITTGSCNIVIGYNAQAYGTGTNNSIVIGHNVSGCGSNTALIGNASTTDTYVKGTLHAACTNFGGIFEANLRSDGIDSCPEGSVVVWRDGKLQGTTIEYDYNVMGVTGVGMDTAIVMGAENILVTGDIEEGDPIVTSGRINHGMKGDRSCDLHGKIIGQALESGSGDSYLIKGMIRKF